MAPRRDPTQDHNASGRLTLVLYNSYDPTRFREAHRRALARAGALCATFDANLATLGMPKPDGASTPVEIAQAATASTTIGKEGAYFRQLAEAGRFDTFPYPKQGLPPQLGVPVLATSRPDPHKAVTRFALRRWLSWGRSLALIVGLGPHGVPRDVAQRIDHHFDLTAHPDKGGFSLETATAMGAALALLLAADEARPKLTTDGILERDGQILVVQRRHPPFAGQRALPGGFVDPGESAAEAVVREVREETGLHTQVEGLVGFYSRPQRDPRRHTATAAFALREEEPTRQPRGGDDAADARFVPLQDARGLAFDHDRILADYLQWKKDERPRHD